MSCMMMKLEPMAALANAIETRLNCGQEYWGFDISDQLHRAAIDCRTAGAYYAEEIYQRLYALNVRAYNSRYKDAPAVRAEDEDAPVIDGSRYVVHHPPVYREHGFAVCPWHYQLAMLLDFWIYQTDEGEVAKDPLRLGIMEFRDMLYRFIVQNSPEYFSIPWGELPAGQDLPCPSEDQEGVCPVVEQNPMSGYFAYLDQLRESGVTNMLGAAPYLQEEFPELAGDRTRAAKILRTWMRERGRG